MDGKMKRNKNSQLSDDDDNSFEEEKEPEITEKRRGRKPLHPKPAPIPGLKRKRGRPAKNEMLMHDSLSDFGGGGMGHYRDSAGGGSGHAQRERDIERGGADESDRDSSLASNDDQSADYIKNLAELGRGKKKRGGPADSESDPFEGEMMGGGSEDEMEDLEGSDNVSPSLSIDNNQC